MALLLKLACLLLISETAVAHLCMIEPHQRGPMNVSEGGDHTCFRHGAPCGGQPAGTGPFPTLPKDPASREALITFQQNFNHYEVGFPGYLDLAYSTIPNPTSDDNFTIWATIPDLNWHQQSHQQNYSILVDIPDVDCAQCTLRVRYNPHKPGEDTFYQCADVTFTKSQTSEAETHHAKASEITVKTKKPVTFNSGFDADAKLYGIMTVLGDSSMLVSADDSGVFYNIAEIDAPVSVNSVKDTSAGYVADQIVASCGEKLYYIWNKASFDDWPAELISVDLQEKTAKTTQLVGTTSPINALICDTDGQTLYALMITPLTGTPGNFTFNLATVDSDTGAVKVVSKAPSENLFVNYQWITVDEKNVYILMGDENAPFNLDTKLYTYPKDGSDVSSVIPDFSKFTISAVTSVGGKLVAASPGLYQPSTNPTPAWSLVEVDPVSGAVVEQFQIAAEGLFKVYYGQNIFGGVEGTAFFHLEHPGDGNLQATSVILEVDVSGKTVKQSVVGPYNHLANMIVA